MFVAEVVGVNVQEDLLDAATGITGCGPAFAAIFALLSIVTLEFIDKDSPEHHRSWHAGSGFFSDCVCCAGR